MKGKGKGQGSADRRSAGSALTESPESKECPLLFPEMTPVDHNRMCPRYSAVLLRTEADGIRIEEIDTLQTELETLLASAAKRMRQLESETSTLSNWQDIRTGAATPPTPAGKLDKAKGKGQLEGKRGGKGGDDKSSKKFKESSGKATQPPLARTPKGKVQAEGVVEADGPKPLEQSRMPKNDAPNRFWALIEPYCQEITTEDLKVLEDIQRSHEDDADYHKIPSLGKHFSQKWAAEDLLEEQREGTKPMEHKRRSTMNNASANASEAVALLKKATNNEDRNSAAFHLNLDLNSDDDASPFGPLTQRLVSALIEENIMTPLEDASIEADAAEAATMSPRSLAKQLNVGNTAQLERRIRRELEEQGILEFEDRTDENPEDEVLTELRKKQQELRVISQHNLILTKRLYKLAKDELARQDLRRKMATVDADVMDAYRKIQAARAKKRTPTKKEKEIALRALKEREQIIKTLETMSGPFG